MNSIPSTPQKVQFKEGENYKDIMLDIESNLNSEGAKKEDKIILDEEEENKSDHGKSILANAEQIFTDEDGLNSQNEKKPSDLLGFNGKTRDRLVGRRLPASSGYENRSPITTDDSPDKIDAP